jgi:hypothetical protein
VVLGDDARRPFEEVDVAQNLLPVQRVLAHLHPLGLVERARLAQDGVGHADLADVVQQRAELQRAQLLFAEPHLTTQSEAEVDDALGVAVRLGVAGFERRRQSLERGAVGVFQGVERVVEL